ncbi:MAG: hypothetical protein ACE5J7_00265 [Candidatus Aenigmatarchaeota archaeon]
MGDEPEYRKEPRERINSLLNSLGHYYCKLGIVIDFHSHNEHDVHFFYELKKDPTKVMHIQGYPGLECSEGKVNIWARVMDREKMLQIRESVGEAVIGNEHEAFVSKIFWRIEEVPYDDEKILAGMLEEECELLKA